MQLSWWNFITFSPAHRTLSQGKVHVSKGWEKTGIKGVVLKLERKYYRQLTFFKIFTRMSRETVYALLLSAVILSYRVCRKECSM